MQSPQDRLFTIQTLQWGRDHLIAEIAYPRPIPSFAGNRFNGAAII